MKRIISMALSILLLFCVIAPFSAYAREQQTSGSCGDNATFELKDGVLTISGTGEITSNPWCNMFETTNIYKAIISEGITVVGYSSFSNCTNLKEVILPHSLKGIKESAFYNCKNLEKADLPSNLKYVGTRAFKACTSLKKIDLPESLETIYSSAFNGCTSAKGKLFLRKSLYIELYAFSCCKGLEEIVFEDGFTMDNFTSARALTIFDHCEGVKKLYIPGSMKSIDLRFAYFTSLTDVTISEGVEDPPLFYNCNSLEKITLPKSAKDAGSYESCKKLKSVKIQSKIGVKYPGSFYNCPNLKSLTFPFGVDSIISYPQSPPMGYIQEEDENGKTIAVPLKGFKIYGKKCKALTEYCKKHDFKFIDMYDVKNAKVTGVSSKTYTGKSIKPKITVKLVGTELKKGTDYTVKYSNTKKVGTAKVTIKGKGKYKGTLTKTFKINPKPTELTKLTAKKKGFKAYWKKNKSQTSGYQLQYSIYKSFKNAKKVTVKGYKTGARTVKDLKSKKKYFVRVRAYKVVDGKKYYSKWSDSKTVRVK